MTFFELFFTSIILIVLYGFYSFYKRYKQTKTILSEEEFERLTNPDTPLLEKQALLDKMEKESYRQLGMTPPTKAPQEKQSQPKSYLVVGKSTKPIGYYLDQEIFQYILLDTSLVYEFDGTYELGKYPPVDKECKDVILGNLRYKYHSAPKLTSELIPLGIVLSNGN